MEEISEAKRALEGFHGRAATLLKRKGDLDEVRRVSRLEFLWDLPRERSSRPYTGIYIYARLLAMLQEVLELLFCMDHLTNNQDGDAFMLAQGRFGLL